MVQEQPERKRYLILGDGYLGNKFYSHLSQDNQSVMCPFKIHSQKDIDYAISHFQPKCVINCIGKTGSPNVDWCESHKADTFFANVVVPSFVYEACNSAGVKMVHIGSGCIYQGSGPWTERDQPNFSGSYYSWTKAVSERYLDGHDVLQIRIRMPLDGVPHARNLLTKLLSYTRVVNSPNSITLIDDLVKAVLTLANKDAKGIYNIVNPGAITHQRLLAIFEEESGQTMPHEFISTAELDRMTLAPRSNCVLSPQKAIAAGVELMPVEDAVRYCAKKYIEKMTEVQP